MRNSSFFGRYAWGILLLAVVIVIAVAGVRVWRARHPGAMTVLESQAMDMSVMKPPTGAVPVLTETIERRPFSATVTYTGSVAPFQEQVIYPRVEGWITDLKVYDGDTVAPGQILAVIDSPDLQSRAAEAAAGYSAARKDVPVAQSDVARTRAEQAAAAADIEAAAADVNRAEAMIQAANRAAAQAGKEVDSARANLDYWRAELAREETLYKSGAVSLQEYQSEKAQAAAAEADLGKREAGLEQAQAEVKAAQGEAAGRRAALTAARERARAAKSAVETARRQVAQKAAMADQAAAAAATASTVSDYRVIRAPFAGMVAKRYQSSGQLANTGTAILNVVQIDRVRLQANVADKDLPLVAVGTPVTARFAKLPDLVLSATVTSIAPLADQSSRTAVVEALVANPRHRLLPGDAVTLSIATSRSISAVTIPLSAIVHRQAGDAVWIVRTEASQAKLQYYCTMHPQVVRDKPGNCPICGMQLVPKRTGGPKKAHLVAVRTGGSDGRRVEILSGLMPGDEVIYDGNTYLREGDAVSPGRPGSEAPVVVPPAPSGPPTPGADHSGGDMKGMPGM